MLQQSSGLGLRGEGSRTLMVIFFGANDAAAPDYHMHVPVDAYGDNLRAMARRCKDVLPGITIVFVSPPPVDEEKLVEYVPCCAASPSAARGAPRVMRWCARRRVLTARIAHWYRFEWYAGRSTELAGAYAEEVARVVEDTGTLLLDIHSLMLRNAEWKSFLSGAVPCFPCFPCPCRCAWPA